MRIDLASARTEMLPDPGTMRAEICIVGGGIAGLVLADRLADLGRDVVLLEAGGLLPSSIASYPVSEVELTGEPHVGSREGRPRGLGGSSTVWGGQLLPMLASPGWPVETGDLQPFYPQIQRLVGTDDLPFELASFLKAEGHPLLDLMAGMRGLAGRVSKFAPFAARNLRQSLGRKLLAHARVRVVLHAHVTQLCMHHPQRVRAVRLRTPGGRELEVEADQIVLAAGTVETCRLLLVSPRDAGTDAECGIGNSHGQVGRGFHDHLTAEVAQFRGTARERAVKLFRPWITGGVRGTLHGLKLEADEPLRQRLGLNFVLAHVTFTEPEGSGAAAVRALLQRRQQGVASAKIDWRGLPKALRATWLLRRDALRDGRRFVSPEARVALRINAAQVVSDRSWIGLSEERDLFGQPLARVHWTYAPEDLRTIRVFTRYLQRFFEASGFHGVCWASEALPRSHEAGVEAEKAGELERPLAGLTDARHAMGGARMGIDAQTSVVGPDLRVHGLDNLYVVSAAVFPDGRPQLPTMTLMALALRLAEHLHRRRFV